MGMSKILDHVSFSQIMKTTVNPNMLCNMCIVVPDIEKAALLAQVYGVTLDSLIKTESLEGVGILPPAPQGKNIWGSVILGDRGQIVIPKTARDRFGMKAGDRLIVASDENGIALLPAESFESKMREFMDMISERP